MKWRHWAILIVLVLLNYIIFATAFTKLAEQRRPQPRSTRTPQPTFETIESRVVSWVIVPTSTTRPTKTPITPSPTVPISATAEITATIEISATANPTATAVPPTPAANTVIPESTDIALPPTTTPPPADALIHTVESGETLSEIAKFYGVSLQAIVEANGLSDANAIVSGQKLVIPGRSQAAITSTPAPATATPQPTNTQPAATRAPTPKPTATPRPTAKPRTATPRPTARPPTATPKPTSATAGFQFTGEVIWDPMVAPNCSGPAISKISIIRDTAGNPVDGVRVEVDCYGNKWASHASGTPGEYDPGHYDFAFGQSTPQDWTCTARVLDINGQAVASTQVISIHFDTNDCDPHGSGHQVAIINWTKHW